MFNLFRKSTNDKVIPQELKTEVLEPKVDLKGKNMNEIVEEIHETFYTEVDRLLADAKISNSLDTDKQELINKCERLQKLGFTNTKEVKEAQTEISRLNQLKQDNENKKNLIEAINYFNFKYPHYKFITEESVKKICEKYNLIYGEISDYIGNVPDKNLKHIEDFKVLEDDECYYYEQFYQGYGIRRSSLGKQYITYKSYLENKEIEHKKLLNLNYNHHYQTVNEKCSLEIAAPRKDFDLTDKEIKDFKISKIEVIDPVVLKPVIFNNQKYYLIVTAWGPEASDGLVVNPIHN